MEFHRDVMITESEENTPRRDIIVTIRKIEIEKVYNMYRVKPAAVSRLSQLCYVGNL
jgi:hypothetical protein